jgi:hypothetical protein
VGLCGKTGSVGDIGDGPVAAGQKPLRQFDPSLHNVLMRGKSFAGSEMPREMKRTGLSDPGKLDNRQFRIEMGVDVLDDLPQTVTTG